MRREGLEEGEGVRREGCEGCEEGGGVRGLVGGKDVRKEGCEEGEV